MSEGIDARTALARLGVRPQTLYAYVSRGRLMAQADPDDPRRSLYRAIYGINRQYFYSSSPTAARHQ